MFNKSHELHGHQAVHVNLQQPSQQTGAMASLSMFGMFVLLLVGLGVIIERLVTGVVQSLSSVLIAALATVTALVPWLAGGVVIVALVVVALRSLPQAMAEIDDIRHRRALAMNNARMLEAKNVDNTIFVVRPERAEAER